MKVKDKMNVDLDNNEQSTPEAWEFSTNRKKYYFTHLDENDFISLPTSFSDTKVKE